MFTNLKNLVIPNGEVVKITSGATVLWEKIEEIEGGLPREYQEVEWIGTNAGYVDKNGYIDLGFAFDTKAKIEMGQYVAVSTSGYIFGAAENSGKLRCMLLCPNAGNSNFVLYGSTGSSYISLTGATLLMTGELNKLTLILEPGNLYGYNESTNSEKVNTTQGSYTMTSNLYLFAQNYNGAPRYTGVNRIAYFRYYDKDDELICDLVPCYRKSDGVIGMYDLVLKKFFVNELSTGTFEKGNDVI